MSADVCSVEGCERPRYCRGWCRAHYERVRVHGDPMAERPLQERFSTGIAVSQVDDKAAYMREYRKRRRDYVVTNTATVNARQAAAQRVADLHPEEFERFLREEMFKRGLLSAAEMSEAAS